jgi:predicted transcriptional regulator
VSAQALAKPNKSTVKKLNNRARILLAMKVGQPMGVREIHETSGVADFYTRRHLHEADALGLVECGKQLEGNRRAVGWILLPAGVAWLETYRGDVRPLNPRPQSPTGAVNNAAANLRAAEVRVRWPAHSAEEDVADSLAEWPLSLDELVEDTGRDREEIVRALKNIGASFRLNMWFLE